METAVVTGLGCISALGDDVHQFWSGLIADRSGISPIRGFRHDGLRNTTAGEVRIGPAQAEHARLRGIRSRIALFADLAIEEALKDSGLSAGDLRTLRVGLVLGVSLGMSLVRESLGPADENADADEATCDDLSLLAGELADWHGITGEALIVSTACAAGTNAIGIARDMIVQEGYDAVVCGGADTLDRMKYLGHSALNTLTRTSIQPFSAERDGTIFGEGAGILVLEAARNLRGRIPHAVCVGAGFSCDAHHVTAPDPSGVGAVHAMREALRDAGLEPGAIDYINLHGSGTPHNDTAEGAAIVEVFGPLASSIPASSIKSAIGHAMGAAGACEAVATVLSVRHQRIPPTVNVRDKAPEFPLRLVWGEAMDGKIEYALSNSFGFGGCNGTVIFSRWKP